MPRFFPLKWKLSLAFVGLSLALVAIYILIAKSTFEEDKIAYVYSADAERLSSVAKSLDLEFEKVLFNATTILAAYEPERGSLSPAGQKVFHDDASLQAIELWSPGEKRSLLLSEKTANLLRDALARNPARGDRNVEVYHDRDDLFLVYMKVRDADKATLQVRLVCRLRFPAAEGGLSRLLLSQTGQTIFPGSVDDPTKKFVLSLGAKPEKKTFAAAIDGDTYLASTAPLALSDLTLVSLTPQSRVLSALGTMYRRSLYFLLLSGFATVIISMLISRGLTSNIDSLTDTVEQVERGDLEARANIQSRDEISILGDSFNGMLVRIQNLLAETQEKSRMESELKTARMVQETLFPDRPWVQGPYELDGYYESASECGGDFWSYWESGSHLFFMIGDVTGHGAAAALMTSAVRSAISVIQNIEESDLVRIKNLCDASVRASSKGSRLMTALFMRLDPATGELAMLNCSHDPAMILRANSETQFVALATVRRLGDGSPDEPATVEHTQLNPGDTLFLFTDGLSEITNRDGKRIREKVFYRLVGQALVMEKGLPAALLKIATELKEFSGKPLEDDMTMVALRVLFKDSAGTS